MRTLSRTLARVPRMPTSQLQELAVCNDASKAGKISEGRETAHLSKALDGLALGPPGLPLKPEGEVIAEAEAQATQSTRPTQIRAMHSAASKTPSGLFQHPQSSQPLGSAMPSKRPRRKRPPRSNTEPDVNVDVVSRGLSQLEVTQDIIGANDSNRSTSQAEQRPESTTANPRRSARLVQQSAVQQMDHPWANSWRVAQPANDYRVSWTETRNPRLMLLNRPQPTENYLAQASCALELLPSPRPLLIVLDLNGTLLARKVGSKNFQPRPRMQEFLRYLLMNHHVMVWSSARPENVGPICDRLFKDSAIKHVKVWDRSHLKLTTAQYNKKVQVYKQLSWIWQEPELQQYPAVYGDFWSQTNTVLIDDSKEKAASEPFNLLQIDKFEALPEQMHVDVLAQVVQYLQKASWWKDVSSFIKQTPFVFDPSAGPFRWDALNGIEQGVQIGEV